MIKPQNIPRESFPKSDKSSAGMVTLNINCDNNEMYHIKDVEYVKRGDTALYIQFIFPDDIFAKNRLLLFLYKVRRFIGRILMHQYHVFRFLQIRDMQ